MPLNKHFRRNFALTALNGIVFNFASAFMSESTVLPAYISRLTGSRVLVGLGGSLEGASYPLPQVLVAPFAEHTERKMPIYVFTAFLRVLSLAALSLVVFASAKLDPPLLLALFFTVFATYSLSGGVAGPAFMDIVAKAIPQNRRGSLWAIRISVGGGFAVIGGFVVTYIIRTLPFPSNYGVLFLAATGFVLIGVILFSLVIEPIQPVAKKKKGFGEHLRDGRQIFREDTNYRGLIYVRLLLGVVFMASPFYVVFAKETGGLQESSVGLLLASQMAGLMLSNILWGNIANKSGSRLVLAGTSLFGTIPPLGALIFPIFRTGQWYFVVLFFFLGVCKAGLGLGYSTILLDISPPLKRLTYIGFISTITSPVLFLPILGGTIVDTVSYRPLFIIAALAGGLALHRAMLLKDVKRE